MAVLLLKWFLRARPRRICARGKLTMPACNWAIPKNRCCCPVEVSSRQPADNGFLLSALMDKQPNNGLSKSEAKTPNTTNCSKALNPANGLLLRGTIRLAKMKGWCWIRWQGYRVERWKGLNGVKVERV